MLWYVQSYIEKKILVQFNLFERPLGLADRRGCTTTMVDNRDFLLFIWLELNDQRPTCSTRPRPLVFIDLKCFLLFIGLVWATTICPHFSVSESYLILSVWFEFSPLGKLSPLLNQSEKSTPTDTPRQSTEALIGWRVSHWRQLRQ